MQKHEIDQSKSSDRGNPRSAIPLLNARFFWLIWVLIKLS